RAGAPGGLRADREPGGEWRSWVGRWGVHAAGVEVHRKEGTRARIDGGPVASLADRSRVFPVQVIDPEIHKLMEEGGRRRRRWLDWAVFHVEPQFADWWMRFARALRQRNAALRES